MFQESSLLMQRGSNPLKHLHLTLALAFCLHRNMQKGLSSVNRTTSGIKAAFKTLIQTLVMLGAMLLSIGEVPLLQ